ncbi:disulfide bond formation protein D [Bacillus sp. J14TS2]|uniref:thioredoxin domain-containing protein n=1 Tax=Bacillus sp. J14TS2 TaxID=2807188 RepID=UPI001B14D4A2|nr:thioredoxin domain-containing protein [Bacillus sp. J14TS2]GIN70804.1 disulfide bond formation protein D [Bacillus sp. J14TS2]
MNNKKLMIITIAVVVIAVAAIIILNQKLDQADQENAPKVEHPNIDNQPTMGEADAPVSIVEFGDYKCPSCKAWSERVLPQLEEDYIDTGQAKLSYINVLFHGEESVRAALASEAVFKQDPENFWAFHESLFAAQPATEQHDEQWVTNESLVEIAQETAPNVELDIDQFDQEIEKYNEEQPIESPEVNLDNQLRIKHNIESTPTVIINGVVVKDPFDYKSIANLIEKGLE